MPLKYLVEANRQSLSESTAPDYEFDYVEIGSVEFGKGIVKKEHLYFEHSPSRARRIAEPGDVIVSTVRTYLRAVAVVTENLIVSTGFAVLHPKHIDSHYIAFMLESSNFTDMVSANSFGISYPAITTTKLLNILIPVPDSNAQKETANELLKVTSKVDKLIHLKENCILELSKYKRSLIYEYVTGKRRLPS